MCLDGNSLVRYLLIVAISFLSMVLLLVSVNLLPHQRLATHLHGVLETNQFTSCEVALSLVKPQTLSVRSALSPSTYGDVSLEHPCTTLAEFYHARGAELSVSSLRHRYLWGARGVYGILASMVPEPQLQRWLSVLTTACIVAVFLLTFHTSRVLGLLILPFTVFGSLFSGVFTVTETPVAIGYLWAWLAGIILWVSVQNGRDLAVSVVCGMVSAFLWFLEGHFMVLVALVAVLTFLYELLTRQHANPYRRTLRNVVALHLGFALCTALFVMLKIGVFDVDSVFVSYHQAILQRAGGDNDYGGIITVWSLTQKLLYVAYQNTSTYGNVTVWKALLLTTGVVAMCALILLGRYGESLRGKRGYILLLGGVSVYCLIRLYALPNHSYLHAFYMARYLFIPLACVWSCLLYLLLLPRISALGRENSA